jgi:phage tail-like protein
MPARAKAVIAVADREFNVQVFKTHAQWSSGLRRRLALDGEGLSLFVNPAFDSWLVTDSWKRGGDIVVDECGQTYWTELEKGRREHRVWNLMRHNPTTDQIEKVLTFAGCGKIEPRKLWLSSEFLWIFDQNPKSEEKYGVRVHTGRMLALSRENSQILHEFALENLIDLDLDKRGSCYTLLSEKGRPKICRHSIRPPRGDQSQCVDRKKWQQPEISEWGPAGMTKCFAPLKDWEGPTKIAVGRNGDLYLLDVKLGRIIRFNPATEEATKLGAPKEDLLKGLKASLMEIDQRGVIFIAVPYEPPPPSNPDGPSKPAALYMFDEDGSYLGEAELPSSVKRIDGIGFDRSGGVHLATDAGLARFSLASNPVGQDGVFYSPTLDNGNFESQWHRLALQGRIPSKSSVEVYYYASDNQDLKSAFEKAFGGPGSLEEKTGEIEKLLSSSWIGPQVFTGSEFEEPNISSSQESRADTLAAPDMLLDPNKGRFLWLKIRLITFGHKTRPAISSARIYYPRLSYLRYLPPAYREDPSSAAFLERFLSLFETIFEGLDQEIDQLFRFFDPRLAPKEFLPWLNSWINLSLDDDVPEDRMRHFLKRAPHLYDRKGTPEALIEFLEIYTGRQVFLTEHSRGLKPLVLGGPDFKLGLGAVLLGSGLQGMRVGDTAIVGYAAVRDRVGDADEPFLPLARRFTIVIDMDGEEFQKREATLKRIVAEQKPAHTSCTIRSTADQKTVGQAVLGFSATVTGSRPYRVGITPIGSGSAVAKDPSVLRLERGAWVGSLKRL